MLVLWNLFLFTYWKLVAKLLLCSFIFILLSMVWSIIYNKFFKKNVVIEFLDINELNNTFLSTLDNLIYRFSYNRVIRIIYFMLDRKKLPFNYSSIFWAVLNFFFGISYFCFRTVIKPIFEIIFIYRSDPLMSYLFLINSYLAGTYNGGWRIYINSNIKINGPNEALKRIYQYSINFVDCGTKSFNGRIIFHPTVKNDNGTSLVVTHGKNLHGFWIVGPGGEFFNMKIIPVFIEGKCDIIEKSLINENLRASFIIGFCKAILDFKESKDCTFLETSSTKKPTILKKASTDEIIKQYNYNELFTKIGANDKFIIEEIKSMYGWKDGI